MEKVMCFSAGASFAAAGTLSVVGLLSAKQARGKELIPLALMPFFFGVQQACEGFVWITVNNDDTASMLHLISMYSFLFFAGMFWPTYVPTSLYLAEKSHKRKRLLCAIMCCGVIVSLLFLWRWILQTPGAVAINHHLDYPVVNYPSGIADPMIGTIVAYILSFLYGAVTIVPFFISSLPHIRILGTFIGISAVIAYIFCLVAFPSVWCFFAAICSVAIYFTVRK
jgi:hypothetical protein